MKKLLVVFSLCIVLLIAGVYFFRPFAKESSVRTPGESIEQFILRMQNKTKRLSRKDADARYNVTISFKKYLHYLEVEKLMNRFGVTSGTHIYYAVHDFKGPPPLAPGKPLSEQMQSLKRNLIEDYSRQTYKGHVREAFIVEELKADKLYIGNITVNITPKQAQQIWNEASDMVRLVQILDDENIIFAGISPEQDSNISPIADAEDHMNRCEHAPDSSIFWPILPQSCK